MSGRKIIVYTGPAGIPLTERVLEMRPVGAAVPLVHPIHIGNGVYDTQSCAEALYRLWDITVTPSDTGVYIDVGSSSSKEPSIAEGDADFAFFGNKQFRQIVIADVDGLETRISVIETAVGDLDDAIVALTNRVTTAEGDINAVEASLAAKFDKAGGTISGFTKLGSSAPGVKVITASLTFSVVAGNTANTFVSDVNAGKILIAECLAQDNSSRYVKPSKFAGVEYEFWIEAFGSGSMLYVQTSAANSAAILGQPVTVTLIYKE